MSKFTSTKVYDGFSTCFRQWKAKDTHCQFLHGYGVSFKVWFTGDLDHRNWVFDFGGMKRALNTIDGKEPKKWLDWLLDHTVLVAEDDPELSLFQHMDKHNIIQLRVVPATGAERFAEYLYWKLNTFVQNETKDRVHIQMLEFREHGKNSAIYAP